MNETLWEVFQRSPQEALQRKLYENAKRNFGKRFLFCWQSSLGTDGVRYGSYRNVSEEELNNRPHQVEFADGAVGIFWKDALYDARAHRMLSPRSIRPPDEI